MKYEITVADGQGNTQTATGVQLDSMTDAQRADLLAALLLTLKTFKDKVGGSSAVG